MSTKGTRQKEPAAAGNRELLRKAGRIHVNNGWGLVGGSYLLLAVGMDKDFENQTANLVGGLSIATLSLAVFFQGLRTRKLGLNMLRKADGDSSRDGTWF